MFSDRHLEVSPSSLLQNELIQRQIGNRLAQPTVLESGLHDREQRDHAAQRKIDLLDCISRLVEYVI
jgi:hypothetical protein